MPKGWLFNFFYDHQLHKDKNQPHCQFFRNFKFLNIKIIFYRPKKSHFIVASVKKSTLPSYLKRFQIPHTDPIEMMTCMMGNDWSAVFGKMWKHHRSLIRLLRQMEWEVWKLLFLFCKEGPNTLIKAQSKKWKVILKKRRTIFISKYRALTLTNLYPSCQPDFFLSGWCLRDQLNLSWFWAESKSWWASIDSVEMFWGRW